MTVDSTDTPETLQQKIDFILDQADRLRRQSATLAGKRKSLQTELRMRNRISDFFDDLALTDPQMEVARSDQGKSQDDISFSEGLLDAGVASRRNLVTNYSIFGSNSSLLQNQEFFANIENLASAEIEKWVEILQKQEKKWYAQADSLEKQADALHHLMQVGEEKF